MKTKTNNSGNALLILIGLLIIIIIGASWFAGTYNGLVRQENGIVAANEDLQNIHTSIFNQIKSQGLSVEKYGTMVTQAITTAIEGRYGKNGSQAAMQWIQENNPTIDSKIFEKLQVVIEAGYNKFESAQRTKIDKLRIYDNTMDSLFTGFVAKSVMGFPKKVTADMRKTITSAETTEMMKTKEMKTIDPFAR